MIKHTIQEIIDWAPSFSLSLSLSLSFGDSHAKGILFLLHLGLEGITEVDTDPEGKFVSFKVTPAMIEFSVCAPSGYSTREQLPRSGGRVLF